MVVSRVYLADHRSLRQPEIENLRLTSIRAKMLAGLDVPGVPYAVCDTQRVGDLAQIEPLDLQRLTSDPIPEHLPLQQCGML